MLIPEIKIEKNGEQGICLFLTGDWKLENSLPTVRDIESVLSSEPFKDSTGSTIINSACFDSSGLTAWDSGLLTFLLSSISFFAERGISPDMSGMPSGVNRLIALATVVPERQGASKEATTLTFFERVGTAAIDSWHSLLETLSFIGDVSQSFARLLTGKACFRRQELMLTIYECGIGALPIVSLISLLVGLILAFVGAIQLQMFGAQLYVADLVGIGMVRAMGAVMTGIIMSGRTGASFAAQIGTMQVNEEIDALQTTGISPIDFLVLPRILALTLMMPLLTIYADLLGILGGMCVGVFGLGLSVKEYYQETVLAVGLTNFWIGLFSALVYGKLVAFAGCMRGMQCGRSASSVGDATRSAVVTGIVGIVAATAVITVICNIIGI